MNCDAYRILISAYVDDELSGSESQRLRTHLKDCESCLQYLRRQESVQAAMKRYTFVQDAPEVPVNFASRITQQLEGELQQAPKPSFVEQVKERFRTSVLGFVDGWIASLKVRPFAWTASASCALVLFTVLLMNEVYQPSPQYLAHQTTTESETVPLDGISVDPLSRFETGEDMDGSEFIIVADLGDAPTGLQDSKESDPMQDYVYSHVVEANQDRLIEDAMLVGYVQDAALIY